MLYRGLPGLGGLSLTQGELILERLRFFGIYTPKLRNALAIAEAGRNGEEQYLGGGKWLANEVAGVAGRVFLQESDDPSFPDFSKNYHTAVGARIELDPPPPAPGPVVMTQSQAPSFVLTT